MHPTGNTILITGGGSGIGQALAAAWHADGNQVVIGGRHSAKLEAVTRAHLGMRSVVLDIDSAESIRRVAGQLEADFPALNVVVHNAGIMQTESLATGALDVAEATITTNLLGPIRLTAALLPRLLTQPVATIITVSSGLAFVPLALNPTYCATKAAIHSYTQSLRYQLKDSAVQVIELVPPYVQTELQGARQLADPVAMPLADFIAETMRLLKSSPAATEICVERVKAQRLAGANGGYDELFKRFNDAMTAARVKP